MPEDVPEALPQASSAAPSTAAPEFASGMIDIDCAALQSQQCDREDIAVLLAALGDHLGAAGLTLDEDGTAAIDIDAGLTVSLLHLPSSPGVLVVIPVAPLASLATATLAELLQANFDWQQTGGGVLGIDPLADSVVLSSFLLLLQRPLQRQAQDLTRMIDTASEWRDALTDQANAPEGPLNSSGSGQNQGDAGLTRV